MLRRAVCLASCVAALLLARASCAASGLEGYDYYIENYDVQVVANADRSYEITETIDVYFNTPSHGIYRDITTWSSAERLIDLRDLRVIGDPYEETGYGSVRIGSADVELTGPHTYVIQYTLWHYADEEPDFDYLYLNLIGTEWDDTPILNATAAIALPEGAEVDRVWLRGGYYGEEDETLASYSLEDGVLRVSANRRLEPNEGLTVDVRMQEGAFADAEVWVPDFTVHRALCEASLDEYGQMTVRESYDMTVNSMSGYRRSFYAPSGGESGSRLTLRRVTLSDGGQITQVPADGNYVSVDFYDERYIGRRVTLAFEYERQFDVAQGDGTLTFSQDIAVHSGDWVVEALEAELTAPFPIGEARMGYGSDGSPDNYEVTAEGNRVYVRAKEPIDRDAQVIVTVTGADFKRRASAFDVAVPLFAFAGLLVVAYFALLHGKRQLTPAVEYAPPEGMNPAEMGYFIDATIDAKDVVSLIYYWASKGYLTIEMRGKKDFTLHRLRELPMTARGYERRLFNALWKRGRGDRVTSGQLNCKFYTHVNDAVDSIKKLFTGSNAIADRRSERLSDLTGCLLPCLLMIAVFAAVAARGFGATAVVVLGVIGALGLSASVFFSARHFWINRHKGGWTVKKWLSLFWIAAQLFFVAWLLVRLLAGRALSQTAAVLTAVCLCLILLLAPMIRRRTRLGDTLLERALGFKQFLTVARREQLEAMLAQNPNYYYDILPYAQVLGVSDIWSKKFEGLTLPEPSWASGDVASAYLFSRMTSSLTDSMTSRPAESGGGGGFSGGGGGFSGGGFSGGGSGGGGGGRW